MTRRERELLAELVRVRQALTRLYNAIDPINIIYDNDGNYVPEYIMLELEYAMIQAQEYIE